MKTVKTIAIIDFVFIFATIVYNTLSPYRVFVDVYILADVVFTAGSLSGAILR